MTERTPWRGVTDAPCQHVGTDPAQAHCIDCHQRCSLVILCYGCQGVADRTENQRYQSALEDIIEALGPDRICDCNQACGLRDEAAHALITARIAIGTEPPQ